MNSSIAGYSLIELFHESANTLIYRATHYARMYSNPKSVVRI